MNVKKFSDKQLKMARKFVRKFDCKNLSCYSCIFFLTKQWGVLFILLSMNLTKERQNCDRDGNKDCSKI